MGGDPTPTTATATSSARWRPSRRTIVVTALVVVVVALWLLSGRLVGFAVVADGLGFDVPRPMAADVEREQVHLGDIEVDRYTPDGDPQATTDQPAILLVPGATPAGRDDGRVVDIAEAVAAAGRTVVVPELEVYDEDLVPEDLDRLVAVTSTLADGHGTVTLAGFSFGGSLALVASADDRLDGQVALVATFGAYGDLAGVAQAATTGVSLVDGERIPWEPDPRAAEVVRDQLLGLLDDEDAAAVAEVLADERDRSELSAELRAVHDLAVHDDPERTEELVVGAPSVVRERIEAVSPLRAGGDLDARVVALHARDDPVIPFGELRRLEAGFEQLDARTLVTFDHVGLDDEEDQGWWVTVRDLWTISGFVHELLDAS